MSADFKRSQWFMIRGLARESGHWGGFLEEMRKAFPEALIETLDLPGAGSRLHEPAPLTIEKTAELVREEFDKKRDTSRPGFALAFSLGAMVVAEWLHQSTEYLDGAVLINTSFRGCSPFYHRLWLEAYPHLLRAVAERDVERRERHVLAMVSNRPELRDRIAREWAEVHGRRPILRTTFARQLVAASRYSPPLKPPRIPVLILNSLSDRMVHPSCSEAIAHHWRCDLRRHPTAGHDLTLDAGPWVAQALGDWLNDRFTEKQTRRRASPER